MTIVYEFWRYDIPTEVAKSLLEELGIPYEEKVVKKREKACTILLTMNGAKFTSVNMTWSRG